MRSASTQYRVISSAVGDIFVKHYPNPRNDSRIDGGFCLGGLELSTNGPVVSRFPSTFRTTHSKRRRLNVLSLDDVEGAGFRLSRI